MNHVALVTGAARRVGAEIAKQLHAKGYNLVIHYNQSKEEAFQLASDLNQKRANSVCLEQSALISQSTCDQLIKNAYAHWNRLDVVVNNASRFYKTTLGACTEAEWDELFNANAKFPFFISQAAADFLKETKGCLINIGDIHGDRPMRDYSMYCMSKAALLMSTKVLAEELAPLVRVNSISPGMVFWPEGANQLNHEAEQRLLNKIPLRRPGMPSDIAKAVVFLATDAPYMTGQLITIDGGRSLNL